MEYELMLEDYVPTLDFTEQEAELNQLNEENCESYIKKWLENLKRDHDRFAKFLERENIIILECDENDLLALNMTIHSWIAYLVNCFRVPPAYKIKYIDQLLTILPLIDLIQQFNELAVKVIDGFQRPSSQRYQQTYIENQSEQVFKEIEEMGKLLMKLRDDIYTTPFPINDAYEGFSITAKCLNNIHFLLNSLIRLNSERVSSSPINDLLVELGINQAKDCVEQAEQFFHEERWDKAVFEMRRAFEIVVTWLVRNVLNNSNWKSMTKDGLEILRQQGIITDDYILNQIKVKDVGLFGLLSIKGVHPEGCSINNLADSDLEATYCISLANAAIKYLLQSFKTSSFFEATE